MAVLQQRRSRSRAVLAVLGLACSPLVACADDDDAPDATDAADTPEEVEVVAVDYEFEGLPDRIEAGTRLTLVNESSSERGGRPAALRARHVRRAGRRVTSMGTTPGGSQ